MAVYKLTGCAGFIVWHTVELLIDSGYQVVGVET